jgi:predicted phosphoribosyltransferase
MFRNREDAGRQLAEKLRGRLLLDPLVLAIPRCGVVTGAALAKELGAEFDVVLARKLRAPGQPALAIGAISEDGQVFLSHQAEEMADSLYEYLTEERRLQREVIVRRRRLYRKVRPPATVAGRSVIVTDDGLVTGSSLIAALWAVQAENPQEVIAAVPVDPSARLGEVRRWCDDVVCLLSPVNLGSIGQFYQDFPQVGDGQVVHLLRAFAPHALTARTAATETARL